MRKTREAASGLYESLDGLLWGFDVFVSYSHRGFGSLVASELHKRLTQSKLRCFLDKNDFPVGAGLTKETQRALKRSSTLVLVADDSALASEWVALEVVLFKKQVATRTRDIIPVDVNGALEGAIQSGLQAQPHGTADNIEWSSIIGDAIRLQARIAPNEGERTHRFLDAEEASLAGLVSDVNRTRGIQARRAIRQRIVRSVVATLVMLLLLAISAAVFAVRQWQAAEERRKQAESAQRDAELKRQEAVLTLATSLLQSDPTRAAATLTSLSSKIHSPLFHIAAWTALSEAQRRGIAVLPFLKNIGGIRDVSLSEDGRTMAYIAHDAEHVVLWDTKTRRMVSSVGPNKRFRSVRISGDGGTILTAEDDGTMALWGRDGKSLWTQSKACDGYIDSLQLSRGSTHNIVSCVDGTTVNAWELSNNWQVVARLALNASPGAKLRSHLVNTEFGAVIGGDSAGQVAIAVLGRTIQPQWHRVLAGPVTALSAVPGGTVAGAAGGAVALLDRKGEVQRTWIACAKSDVVALDADASGRTFVACGDGKLLIVKGTQLVEPGHHCSIGGCSLENGILERFASRECGNAGAVDIGVWSNSDSVDWRASLSGQDESVGHVETRLDNDLVLTASGYCVTPSPSGTGPLRVWNLAQRHPLAQLVAPQSERAEVVAVSPRGELVAMGRRGKDPVRIVNLSDNTQAFELGLGTTAGITDLVFADDGKSLVSCDGKSGIRLWNLTSKTSVSPKEELDWDHHCYSVAVSRGYIATASTSGYVTIWREGFGKFLGQLKGSGPAFSQSGDRLFVCEHGDKVGYDDDNTLLEVTLPSLQTRPLGRGCSSLQRVSPDGRILATGYMAVYLWDLEKRRVQGVLDAHHAEVTGLAFPGKSGTLLATADATGWIRLWSVQDHRLLGVPIGASNLTEPTTVLDDFSKPDYALAGASEADMFVSACPFQAAYAWRLPGPDFWPSLPQTVRELTNLKFDGSEFSLAE